MRNPATALFLLFAFANTDARSIPSATNLALVPREDTVDYTTVKCTAQFINDASSKPYDRWKAAGADQAWADLSGNSSQKDSSLKYTEHVSNFFNSKDSMICSNMDDGPCSDVVTCDQVKYPAGQMILNSFVNLHNMRHTIYESLNDALGLLNTRMSTFQSTFSPEETPSNQWIKDLLTVFQAVVGIGSAFSWNILIKEAKIFSDPNFGFAKDSFNAAVSAGFTLGRDHAPKAEELQNELTGALGDFMDGWMKAELAFLNTIFSGTGDGYTTLTALTKDGLALPTTRDLDLGSFVDEVQKIVYGKLVTIAWSSLAKKPEVQPGKIFPMILMSDKDCATKGDDVPSIVSQDDAGKIAVCYNKKTFYIGYPEWKGAPTHGGGLMDLKFTPLPGGTKDELSGSDKWKGLSLEDIVVSSFSGWTANGGKNGYKMPDFAKAEADSQKLLGEDGIRTAGFLQLPMCTKDRLQVTATKWQADLMAGKLPAGKTPSLPCGTGELFDSERAAWGM